MEITNVLEDFRKKAILLKKYEYYHLKRPFHKKGA